jgi:DNA primase
LSTDDLTRLWQAPAAARSRPPRDRAPDPDDRYPPDGGWSAEPQEIDYSSFGPSDATPWAPRQVAGGSRRPWVDKPYFGKRKPPEEGTGLPRAQPTSPADSAVKMLLLHSEWWEQLDAGDLELLHELPAPHGALCAWMERHVQDNGATPWAVWEQALRDTDWAGLVRRIVTTDAQQEDLQFADFRRVLDGMWVRQLERQLNQLSQRAATDPEALAQWREVDQHRRRRLQALSLAPGL